MTFYQPKHFDVGDRTMALELMRAHPFATLASVHEGAAQFTHLPLVAEERDGRIVLLGHVARANVHWQALENGAPTTAVFHGPDGYVSPSWYTVQEAVPTWNYIVVHAHGAVTVTHDGAAKERILKALIDVHDPPYRRQWDALSETFRERHKAAIVGFEIAVDRIEAKFKLSQNRSAADRAGVLGALIAGEQTTQSKEMAAWMRRLAG